MEFIHNFQLFSLYYTEYTLETHQPFKNYFIKLYLIRPFISQIGKVFLLWQLILTDEKIWIAQYFIFLFTMTIHNIIRHTYNHIKLFFFYKM